MRGETVATEKIPEEPASASDKGYSSIEAPEEEVPEQAEETAEKKE